MKLSEAIKTAKVSELNTLNIASDTEAVITLINLALVELYNLFALRTEEAVIPLRPDTAIYDLPSDFMYLVSAYTTKDGKVVELPVNEEKDPNSVNTVGYNRVQVPFFATSTVLSVVYVQLPPTYTIDDLDVELPVPPQLYQALFCYVAYKAHGAIRLNGQSEGDVYYARFKKICDELRQRGTAIASDDISMDMRVYDRGFP